MPANFPKMTPPELNNGALREPVPANLLGTAVLDKTGDFEAGTYQSFTLTYTAGRFGIDDSGSLRIRIPICHRSVRPSIYRPKSAEFHAGRGIEQCGAASSI